MEGLVTGGEGVPISWLDLSVGGREVDAARAAQSMGSVYEQIFCATGSPEHSRAAVETISVSFDAERASDLARMCSGVVETQTTTNLDLHIKPAFVAPRMQRRVWECMAYALFSSHARARSSVSSVRITGFNMTEADANAVAAVLASPDLTRLLFEGAANDDVRRTSTQDSDRVELTTGLVERGTMVTLGTVYPNEAISAESPSWTMIRDVHGVKMLSDADRQDDDVARVIIPGYGPCAARRNQVIRTTNNRWSSGGVTSLALECYKIEPSVPEPKSCIQRLLRLVGSSLTRLALYLPADEGAWSASMLQSCPSLKVLVVKSCPINISSLLEVCRSQQLSLEVLEGSFDDARSLMREVGSKNAHIARSLSRLTCIVEHEHADEEDLTSSVIAMLEVNDKLEYLHMRVPVEEHDRSRDADIRSFHGEEVAVFHVLLPLESRVAFLSVFTDAKPGIRATSAPKRLVLRGFPMNRGAFSLIFDFAAICARRRVYVTLSEI